MKKKSKTKPKTAPKSSTHAVNRDFVIETVDLSTLKPHPRNYRKHPEDQIAHYAASVEQFGVYKNFIVASDYTILAGHGLMEACKRAKVKQVPVKRFNFGPEDPRAIKIIAIDNELGLRAEIDDRILTDILKSVKDVGELFGTGYDDQMLANLVMVTRHADEIADVNEAAEWVGMPAFENVPKPFKLVISFENVDARNDFLKLIKVGEISKTNGPTLSMWWPQKARKDLKSLRFTENGKTAST